MNEVAYFMLIILAALIGPTILFAINTLLTEFLSKLLRLDCVKQQLLLICLLFAELIIAIYLLVCLISSPRTNETASISPIGVGSQSCLGVLPENFTDGFKCNS